MIRRNIYLGSIRMIKNGEDYLYQQRQPLLFLGNGRYVNIRWIYNLKDHQNLRKAIQGQDIFETVIYDKIKGEGIYVDKESLDPLYEKRLDSMISIRKVKRDAANDFWAPPYTEFLGNGTAIQVLRLPNPNKPKKKK